MAQAGCGVVPRRVVAAIPLGAGKMSGWEGSTRDRKFTYRVLVFCDDGLVEVLEVRDDDWDPQWRELTAVPGSRYEVDAAALAAASPETRRRLAEADMGRRIGRGKAPRAAK